MEKIKYNGTIYKKVNLSGLINFIFSRDNNREASFSTPKSQKLFRNPFFDWDVVIIANYNGEAYYDCKDMDYGKKLGWDEIRPAENEKIKIEKILVREKSNRIFEGWMGNIDDLTDEEEEIIKNYEKEIEEIYNLVEYTENNEFYNF